MNSSSPNPPKEKNLQRTPLWPELQRDGAKFFTFAGWDMPMEYQQSWRKEHLMVREKAGLFDVSHMGEIRVKGSGSKDKGKDKGKDKSKGNSKGNSKGKDKDRDSLALKALQYVTSNDVSRLAKGQAQYSLFLNEKGGIVDDLIVYCFEEGEDYLLCVNAANKQKDLQWLLSHCKDLYPHVAIEDESDKWAQLAVQGPLSFDILENLFPGLESRLSRPFSWVPVTWPKPPTGAASGGGGGDKGSSGSGGSGDRSNGSSDSDDSGGDTSLYIARTGYTGEKGVEIFVPPQRACALWRELQETAKKKELDLAPVGLIARDSLRLEMKYPLHGQDIDEEHNPFQAGLSWVVKMNKEDFVGKSALSALRSSNEKGKEKEKALLKKVLVGFRLLEKGGIPRKGYPLFSLEEENRPVGYVTSGTFSPCLQEAIGLAYIDRRLSEVGSQFLLDFRGRRKKAQVVKTPFIQRK